jgi:ABC-type nickel/cobalt efflux system permease component RcnA
MSRFLSVALAVVLISSPILLDNTEAGDESGDHHEHSGWSDAHPGQGAHSHGDSDDHHDKPNSPCHHHIIHCCCGHAHAMLAAGSVLSMVQKQPERLDVLSSKVKDEPILRRFFHVPIA